MRIKFLLPILFLGFVTGAIAESPLATKPADSYFAPFNPIIAPQPTKLLLKKGDRLAICGDSITEQKKYSRIIEDYLTVCVPQLQVTVRQYGWSGEKAPGFLSRMTNDCLRFDPTIATTCYGMNDFEYRPYEDRIGKVYTASQTAIVEAFKAHGARVILGSAGCVGKIPRWAPTLDDTLLDLNLSLCHLRNIDIGIAQSEQVGFADVFWPMLTAGFTAQQAYGTNFTITSSDGVHPGWAGHTVMAYAYLKALGLDGNIGTFTVNLKRDKMKVTKGHRVISESYGEYEIESTRYPFCPCVSAPAAEGYPVCGQDDVSNFQSIRSGMSLVPFNQELNRLTLIAKNGTAANYKVTWGEDSKTFTAGQLAEGINLAAEFPHNPFSDQFAKVDAAVAAKQDFETDEIKNQFEAQGQNLTREQIAERTAAAFGEAEVKHCRLAVAVAAAFAPVTHTIKIEAE
ncbi:MAG: SGNH/GDSL hydrolase family protein [Verrucomicrobiota bacterium]|jgi:lysophospholipase L1-like esterase